MNDWTCAFDDGLVQRLTHCTLCGRQPVSLWGICGTLQWALAYVLCQACRARDGVLAVERLCAQRYLASLGQTS